MIEEIEVVDLAGRSLYSHAHDLKDGQMKLDLSFLPSGEYILKIKPIGESDYKIVRISKQ